MYTQNKTGGSKLANLALTSFWTWLKSARFSTTNPRWGLHCSPLLLPEHESFQDTSAAAGKQL
jgi:hypothetical protein